MDVKRRKLYRKPTLRRVKLNVKESVLTLCKTSGGIAATGSFTDCQNGTCKSSL